MDGRGDVCTCQRVTHALSSCTVTSKQETGVVLLPIHFLIKSAADEHSKLPCGNRNPSLIASEFLSCDHRSIRLQQTQASKRIGRPARHTAQPLSSALLMEWRYSAGPPSSPNSSMLTEEHFVSSNTEENESSSKRTTTTFSRFLQETIPKRLLLLHITQPLCFRERCVFGLAVLCEHAVPDCVDYEVCSRHTERTVWP